MRSSSQSSHFIPHPGILGGLLLLLFLLSCKPVEYTQESVKPFAPLQGVAKEGYQGMSIYDDYLVGLQNTGIATIYCFRLTASSATPSSGSSTTAGACS